MHSIYVFKTMGYFNVGNAFDIHCLLHVYIVACDLPYINVKAFVVIKVIEKQ